MDVLRNRLTVALAALAVALAVPACGDDDGKGAAEEVEKGLKKGTQKLEKEGRELEDDVKGKDEKRQRD